ncbi:DEAD/DEAH box helicase [Streptacidiphilus albus]|uniref:DEAD/DEAH box helicase n=1 Tax=Streptacidiphilus albus TaxID=105425 RepID=UPI00054BF134|nr:DEAD/DEAH box helicase [Streptacidiphilus albus]
MAFQGKSTRAQQQFPSPEELYLSGTLPRTTEAVDGLWLHQGDVIRAYAEHHQKTPDLALELPTGSGKTIPGVLIAEWVRRKSEGPVIYATPTKQLARQVLATARREGVPSHLLIGNHRQWDITEASAVEGAEAIGVTTYSAIFNSSPKLPQPRLIVLDDAHAGEQFVGTEYGVTIRRHENPAAYEMVLDALSPFLSGLLLQRLRGAPDPGAHHQVRLLLPAIRPEAIAKLDAALATLPEYKFDLAMIRSGLASCCVYLSYGGIQIRPMIPPTFDNRIFSHTEQRIYLSATLGSGGELERAFGRAQVVRMPLPTKTPPRSGRRLFVFPDLVEGGDAVGVSKRIVGLTNKALVLSQETLANAEKAAAALAGDGVPVMGRDDVELTLDFFAKAPFGVLGLANRYDGLDLPGRACRIVVLGGKPDAVGLQERFLSERAEASAALAERLRTRIVQGAGRCTRGPNDYAVVVVLGSDITRYFGRPDNRAALEPELQAEVEFGWRNSRGMDADDVIGNVETFLAHDAPWRENGERLVAEFRQDALKVESPSADALGNSAAFEVEAWHMAFRGEWLAASEQLQEAARRVGTGGDSTRGYRGLLLYLAGVWLHLGAEDETRRARARDLVRQAAAASNVRGTWLKEMPELPGAEEVPLADMDVIAVNAIVARLRGQLRPNRVTEELQKMREAVAQDESTIYEGGLTTLGTFLGAEASKPRGQGRCDSAWVWGTAIWMTIEAKSEQHPDGLLPLHDIRQANTQLDQLAGDRSMDHPPAGSPAIIVSDRLTVDPQHARAANANVYLASTETVEQIAGDISTVWSDLLTSATGIQAEQLLRQHVRAVMTEHGCLPSQVIDRLMQTRIRPGD